MKNLLLLIVISILTFSCSNKGVLRRLLAPTPNIIYDKPNNYKGLSKYQKDAIYLTELVKQSYPRLNQKVPEYKIKADSFISSVEKIKSDFDFEIKIKKFLALLKDGHTNIEIDYNRNENQPIYNIFLFKEKTDWIVGNIDKSVDSNIINSKLISINGFSTKQFEEKINNFECGENQYWRLNQFSRHYYIPKYWEALGITKENDSLIIRTINNNRNEKFHVLKRATPSSGYNLAAKAPKTPFTLQQNDGFFYKIDKENNYAYLQINTMLDYVSIKNEIGNYTNFITKPIALWYAKRWKKNALDFGKISQSLFREIEDKKVKNLIVDLRYNDGGDERVGKQLLWYLKHDKVEGFTRYDKISEAFKSMFRVDYKKYNEMYLKKHKTKLPFNEINITKEFFDDPYFYDITKKDSPYLLDSTISKFSGKLYVIIGSGTFSAAQILATTISDNKLGIIVGSPAGNKPTTQSGFSYFKLPDTDKIINISTEFIERPDKSKNEIDALYPDIEIYQTFQGILNGEDPKFEYIMKEIKSN